MLFGIENWQQKKKRLECGNWSSGIYRLDLPFGIEFYFFKKISGNLLVALVSASVVWFCFSEHKIKHTQKKKKEKEKKRSERGNWSSSMVWFCLLE